MARLFNGSSDQLGIASALVTAYPFTLAAWMRAANVTANMSVIGIYDTAAGTQSRWDIEARGGVGGDPIRFVSRQGGVQRDVDTSSGFSANTWHHVCGVGVSATERTVFLDGGSKATDTQANTPVDLDVTALGVLKRGDGDAFFVNGRIAEAAIWSVALTDAEVLALSLGLHPLRVRRTSIVAYWPTYGLGSPEADLGGAGNNLTVTGTTLADHAPVIPYSARFWGHGPLIEAVVAGGRIMSSLTGYGGLAGHGGIAGQGGGLAA